MKTAHEAAALFTHPDPLVRDLAALYFHDAPPDCPITALDALPAIRQFGSDRGMYLSGLIYLLPLRAEQVPVLLAERQQADRDLRRLIEMAISQLDLETMIAAAPTLRAAADLPESVPPLLDFALSHQNQTPEALWEQLVSSLSGSLIHGSAVSRRHLVAQALARHEAFAREKIRAELAGADMEEAIDADPPMAALLLAGTLSAPEILPDLLRLLAIDTDMPLEWACNALRRIGTPEVVHQIVALQPAAEWYTRLYSQGVLGDLRIPEAETAVRQLLDTEDDQGLRTSLVGDLCRMFADDAFTRALDLVRRHDWDPQVAELDQHILALATLQGEHFPEERGLRRRAEKRLKRQRALMADMDRGFPPPAATTTPHDRDHEPAYIPPPLDEAPLRTAPKVGRNDPCPCGSGKKYKKCCGK